MKPVQITRETLMDGTLRARQREYAKVHPDMRWRSDDELVATFEAILASHPPGEDLWVFGYGSLMWNPAFEYEETRPALLRGWHRRFCLKMLMGRGTPERPGLMLALDHGGACRGLAFRIAAAKAREELWLLWQREMYGSAYHARWVWIEAGGRRLRAVTFVINRDHPRYVKELSPRETAALITSGCGDLGTCREYFENTMASLRAMGVRDSALSRIAAFLPSA
ncbi:gamma-glutamylcyclotransferase [Acidocella sp.]|uniref:gamma-glutamylcyclotransferase n=1 Tax=Acidocella sp. TaxID=50710 RepID=UPI0026268ACA|nr:gamma-glutamylcyclotransferase [Acidocella sp.]